jgi:peptidoglycan/LPS O-acetylase OafA/YrhL
MQDILRFLLSLAVIIYHYKHFAIQSALGNPREDYIAPYETTLGVIYVHGYHAVAVFFFLSGYMLASKLNASAPMAYSCRDFLLKRLARIYPGHAASLIAMGLLAIIINQLSLKPFITYNDDVKNFVASIFLINGTGIMRDTSFNLPAWSLSVEFVCYVTLGAIYARFFRQKTVLFVIALLFGVFINEIFSDPNASNVGSGMVFFFAGAITSTKFEPWYQQLIPRMQIRIAALLIISASSFFISLTLNLGLQKLIWIFLSFPTFVVAITSIDNSLNENGNRPFMWLGLISFSIYIWHFPVQASMFYLIGQTYINDTSLYNAPSLMWTYLISVILIAQLSLVTIEKWGSTFLSRYLRNRTISPKKP